jgi:hypothetical protein
MGVSLLKKSEKVERRVARRSDASFRSGPSVVPKDPSTIVSATNGRRYIHCMKCILM